MRLEETGLITTSVEESSVNGRRNIQLAALLLTKGLPMIWSRCSCITGFWSSSTFNKKSKRDQNETEGGGGVLSS